MVGVLFEMKTEIKLIFFFFLFNPIGSVVIGTALLRMSEKIL